ncbi:MAG: tripartite tricarboxylate transporter substrate binding protein [Burkholderiaceae bacterium]
MKRVAIACLLWIAAACAVAQPFPSKPITMVIPFPPGGVSDIVGRAVAARLATVLGVSVVVENKAGASGILGAEAAARARPDGYTLMLGNISTLGTNPASFAKLPYDPEKSFAAVSMLAVQPLVVAVGPRVPAETLADLVRLAKARGGALTYGTAGSSIQLAVELFASQVGVRMTHIPYKGSAPAITDLLGGQIDVLFDPISSLYPQVKAGKARGLAVTTAQRSPVAPELPTVAESGVERYDVSSWQALVAPAGTPPGVVAQLNDAVAKVLASAEVRELFARQGAQPTGSTPAELEAFVRAEVARWKKVAADAGVAPQ